MKNLARTLSILILIVLQIGLFGVSYYLFKGNGRGNIFSRYFQISDNLFFLPGARGESDKSEKIQEFESLYEQKDFENLINKINDYLKQNPGFYELKFYRGLAYLELKQSSKAIRDFEDILLENKEFAEDAEWYLALSYLQLTKEEKAFGYFREIADKNGKYSPMAKKIIVDMEVPESEVAQIKIYQVSEDGRFEFFNSTESNSVRHPITERTFYLEAVRQNVIPNNVSYPDFVKLTVPEKQQLVNNSQQEILATLDKSKRDLYAEILNSSPFPGWALQYVPETTAIATVNVTLDEVKKDSVNPLQNPLLTESAQNSERYSIPSNNSELGLPWIVDAMLRPKSGKNLPTENNYEAKKETAEISWVVKSLTLQTP